MRVRQLCTCLSYAAACTSFCLPPPTRLRGASRRPLQPQRGRSKQHQPPAAALHATAVTAPRQPPQFSEGSTIEQAIQAATDGDWKRASILFRACVRGARSPPRVRDCNRFLRVLGDGGRLEEAVCAYEDMLRAGLTPTIVTFSTLISRAGALGNTALAERFFQEMLRKGIQPDAPAMNSLINAFAKIGAVERAMGVFEQMSSCGVSPTIITFNSLLDACVRADDADRAANVFAMVSKWGLQPNERTYSILIHSHAKGKRVEEAFGVLLQMEAAGITPNTCTYSTLINACAKAGQLQRAFDTLRSMTGRGLEPNVVTWTTLIHACSKSHQLEMGFSLFREMMVRGVPPNGVTCSALMDGCLKHGEVDLAFQVLDYMLDTGIEPTKVTYTSLLTECARLGRADRAAQVLRRMHTKLGAQQRRQEQRAAAAATVKGAAAAAAKSGQAGGASTSSSSSSSLGLGSDLLQLFGKARRVDEAFTVLEDMISRREFPDSDSWSALFDAVETGRQFDHAMALVDGMRDRGEHLPINEVTYGALLGACGRVNKLMRAFLLIKAMKERGVTPSEATYLQLLELCRQQRKGQAAADVFEAMRSSGVKPGVKSYTSLLQTISDDNSRRSKAMKKESAMWGVGNSHATGSSSSSGSGSVAEQPEDAGDWLHTSTRNADTVTKLGMTDNGDSLHTNMPSSSAATTTTSSSRHAGGVEGEAQAYVQALPHIYSDSEFNPAADNLFRVFLVFGEMKSQGLHPDRPAYNALINSCAAVGDLDRAMAVLMQMYEDDHCQPPDVVTFTSLIKTAAAAHNADAAEEIFAAMQQRTNHFSTFQRPTERTFRHMMVANMNVARYSRVQELWEQMLQEGIIPSARSCSQVLAACHRTSNVMRALAVYGVMTRAGIRPDNRSLLSLVRLCESAGMDQRAREIMRHRSSQPPAA